MPGSGTHRIHVLNRGTGKWFEIQDLHVTEILPQMIPLSETLIQVSVKFYDLNFMKMFWKS